MLETQILTRTARKTNTLKYQEKKSYNVASKLMLGHKITFQPKADCVVIASYGTMAV